MERSSIDRTKDQKGNNGICSRPWHMDVATVAKSAISDASAGGDCTSAGSMGFHTNM